MDYSLSIIDKQNRPVTGAVVSFAGTSGVVFASFPVPGGTFSLSSELDSDLFGPGVSIHIKAPGFHDYQTPMSNATPYDQYSFIMTEKPSLIKPIVMGAGIAVGFAFLYGALKGK
jgi:hypothetical protein